MTQTQAFIDTRKTSISREAVLLYEALRTLEESQRVSWEELGSVISMPANYGRGYRYLNTAKQKCLREHDIDFKTIIGFGLQRLSNEQIAPNATGKVLKTVRNQTSRANNRLDAVDVDRLGQFDKNRYYANRAMLGMAKALASKRTQKKVEQVAQKKGSTINYQNLFDAMVNLT